MSIGLFGITILEDFQQLLESIASEPEARGRSDHGISYGGW